MTLTIEDLRGKTVEEAMQLGADITSPAQKEARKKTLRTCLKSF
ncbi:hypothetical protein [Bacillus thuringiensis]|nr:hypothetical protein [Bacillus thuringiensis]